MKCSDRFCYCAFQLTNEEKIEKSLLFVAIYLADVVQVDVVVRVHPLQCGPLVLEAVFTVLYCLYCICTVLYLYCTTGCPVKLFPLGNLLFCWLLLMQISKVGTFL